MNEFDFRKYAEDATEFLRGRNKTASERFGLDKFQDYDYDIPNGRFWWSDHDVRKVEAECIVVGSVSTASGTWLWSWANPQLEAFCSPEIERVREYGNQHDIPALTRPKWPGDEIAGWEMTSIAAFILDSEGAYRSPFPDGCLFLLLNSIKEVSR
jgi:hypothetical protein